MIRPGTAADRPALLAVFRASVREIGRRHYSDAQVRAWAAIDADAWPARLAGRRILVAEIAGRVAGFAAWEADGHLDMLFVDPAFERRGVGSALLAAVEAAVPGRIVTEASLAARPLLLARGYREVARQTVRVRGRSLVNFRMSKG